MKNFISCLSIVLLFQVLMPDLYAQYCLPLKTDTIDFQSKTRFVKVETGWYPDWLEIHDGKQVYPKALAPLDKWNCDKSYPPRQNVTYSKVHFNAS